MLKCVCVYDREVLGGFYKSIGREIEFDNFSMFFGLIENEDLLSVIRLYPDGNRRVCLEEIAEKEENPLYDEFVLKSCINYALTFSAEQIACSKKYEKWLLPMHFFEENGQMVGNISEIDFPHACCGK